MIRAFAFSALTLLALGFGILVHALERPAPPPSRYVYSFKVDADSLPSGVKLREVKDAQGIRYFISNDSEKPLIINERFQNETGATAHSTRDSSFLNAKRRCWSGINDARGS